MSITQIDQIVRRYFDPSDTDVYDDDDAALFDRTVIHDAALSTTPGGDWQYTGAVWNLIRQRIDAIERQDWAAIESLYDQIVAILHPETAGER